MGTHFSEYKQLSIVFLILSFAKVLDKWVKDQLSDRYKDNILTGRTLYQMLIVIDKNANFSTRSIPKYL